MVISLFRPTIEVAFSQFLNDQQYHQTSHNIEIFEEVLYYLRQYLEQDGYESLPDELKEVYKNGLVEKKSFIQIFNTAQILPNVYGFMKDITYQQAILPTGIVKNAERVLHRLSRWLLAQGFTSESSYLQAMEGLPHFSIDLDSAEVFSSILFDFAREEPPVGKIFDELKEYVEIRNVHRGGINVLPIKRNDIMPFLKIPQNAYKSAKNGWWIDVHIVQTSTGWHFLDVGNVLP